MLPLMDGWEICRRVKSDTETKHIPILMLTARSSAEDVVQGLDLGADDYMRKPFPLDELLARVRDIAAAHPAAGRYPQDHRKWLLQAGYGGEGGLAARLADRPEPDGSIRYSRCSRGAWATPFRAKSCCGAYGECPTAIRARWTSTSRACARSLTTAGGRCSSAQTLRGRGYRLVWEEGQE